MGSGDSMRVSCGGLGYLPPDKEMVMEFNSILIGSEDPARLVAYYARLFG